MRAIRHGCDEAAGDTMFIFLISCSRQILYKDKKCSDVSNYDIYVRCYKLLGKCVFERV